MSRNKIGIGVIVIAVIALAIVSSVLFVISSQHSVSFAGLNWNTELNNYHREGGSCDGSAVLSGNNLVLNLQVWGSQSGAGCDEAAITQNPINNFDEIDIVFSSTHYSGYQMGTGAGIFLTDGSRRSDAFTSNDITRLVSYTDSTSYVTSSVSQFFDVKYVGFRNNHDGTYSLLRGTGVSDFVVVSTYTAPSPTTPVYLGLIADGGGGAGGDKASVSLTAYAVITKINGFAVCKADQLAVDKNADGQITPDECIQRTDIQLISQQAFKESFDAQLARIQAENQAKLNDLNAQIIELKSQPVTPQFDNTQNAALIADLQKQLDDTKSILNAVQARDKNVLATIQANEPFVKPNFIAQFFDNIIAWFKTWFL